MQWLTQQGFDCLGVDRDSQALATAQAFGEVMQADLENHAWPLAGRQFAGVVVTNYLWRVVAVREPKSDLQFTRYLLKD